MKFCLSILLALCSITLCDAQKNSKNIIKDFNSIVGSWTGTLSYLDYTSGKSYTMPADIEIKRLGSTSSFILSNIYPKEQSANSVDTIQIFIDEQFIDKEIIKTRKVISNGDIEIVTEEKGTDGNDNKPATFRHTYILGSTHFIKRKEIQFEGETIWIKRHEYSYSRKPNR